MQGWLFFDTAYVAVASNITCPSSNPVYTTVQNVVLDGNVTVSVGEQVSVVGPGNYTISPSWVHHGGTGYIFLDNPLPTVYLHVGQLNGNWINSGVTNQSISLDTVSINIDNTNPHEATRTAYIVVPNVTASEMPAIAAAQAGLQVVYTTSVHAALNTSSDDNSGMLQAVFWEAGNVSFDSNSTQGWSVAVSEPCMILVDVDDEGSVTVTASNPDTPSLALTVSINRALSGPGCTGSMHVDDEDLSEPYTVFSFVLPAFFGNSTAITCSP